jgi:hypothetical protein
MSVYRWLNKEKSRYFTIAINIDGTNSVILNYSWGGCYSNRGGKKNILVQTQEEAYKFIEKMMKRRKHRGYELIYPLT